MCGAVQQAAPDDAFGLLAREGGGEHVERRRGCACALLHRCVLRRPAGGAMPYYEQVMHSCRPSFAFETRLECLQQMARSIGTLPDQLHLCRARQGLYQGYGTPGRAAVVVGSTR